MTTHSFRRLSLRALVILAALVTSAGAQAHDGHAFNSFFDGFAHPWSGFDHVLAMLAVGLWAMQMRRKAARWALPLGFAGSVVLFALAAYAGVLPAVIDAPLMESGIILSLMVLGVLLVLRLRPPPLAAFGVVALMGAFHGHAHGVSMFAISGTWVYAAGFVLATLLLHGLGLLAAQRALQFGQDWMLRVAGAVVMTGGLAGTVLA